MPWPWPPSSWHFGLDEIVVKVLLTCLLCGLIGLEREYRQKTAGFRTHLLVGLGSTMFTLLSLYGFGASDPSRIAAQIVSGIGFIGAGAILRQGLSVRGLTTASTLWLVASIGMAVGVGWYEPALITTVVALLALIALTNVERFLPAWPTPILLQVRLGLHPDLAGAVRDLLREHDWTVRRGSMEKVNAGKLRLSYLIRKPAGTDADVQGLLERLEALPGLDELGWEVVESAS